MASKIGDAKLPRSQLDPLVPTSTRDSVPKNSKIADVVQEGLAFALTYLRVVLNERANPYKSLTADGRFNHYLVLPLFRWHGENERIVTTPSLGQVRIKTLERTSQEQVVINGGCHNYADFYTMSSEDESVHRKCLDKLPFANAAAVPLLNDLMLKYLARFFDTNCCFSTPTGFQANVLGIPAVAGDNALIIVDEKSHNSIFTAAFTAPNTTTKRFRHNDMTHLESLLSIARVGASRSADENKKVEIIVVVEGLYSMDGTIPPLGAMYDLKKRYDFTLYVDEAHSFGSIGKTGRGCFELWNDEHPSNPIPADAIDIRSAVLSKAVGGLGGFVCATSQFKDRLHQRATELKERGESLTTSTMLQTLSFLIQPRRLERNLRRLRDLSHFCHEELERQGVYVHGDSFAPMLPVHAGRPSKASELSHVLRQAGLVASPVSAPAVEIFQSRVRITLSASYSDADVNGLIDTVVKACEQVGLRKENNHPRQIYRYVENMDEKSLLTLKIESQEAPRFLEDLIQRQVQELSRKKSPAQLRFEDTCVPSVIEAGHAARQRYGIGSGSARWILGTFVPHLEMEEMLARTVKQPCAMTYADSDLGLMSTVASLCRPVLGRKKHYFLLPAKLPSTAEEGLRVASKKSGTTCIRYADHSSMIPIFRALVGRKDTYITLYLEPLLDGRYVDLKDMATRLAAGMPRIRGCTLLINDFAGLGVHGLGVTASVDMASVSRILSARILVSGSFYHGLGLPGGYLAGEATLIEELQYTSRCYMFTTSPQPFVVKMIEEALRWKLASHGVSVIPGVPKLEEKLILSKHSKLRRFEDLGIDSVKSSVLRWLLLVLTLILSTSLLLPGR